MKKGRRFPSLPFSPRPVNRDTPGCILGITFEWRRGVTPSQMMARMPAQTSCSRNQNPKRPKHGSTLMQDKRASLDEDEYHRMVFPPLLCAGNLPWFYCFVLVLTAYCRTGHLDGVSPRKSGSVNINVPWRKHSGNSTANAQSWSCKKRNSSAT